MCALHKNDHETDRTMADEGTTGHKLAEMLLLDRGLLPAKVIGTVHEETGVVFDDAMWDGAVQYVDYIASTVQEGATWEAEAELPVPEVHPASKVVIDAYSYDSVSRHLNIYDYKYGYKPVEAFENLQLVHGASAVFTKCELEEMETPVTVTFHIVQPRGFHHGGPCRSWSVPFDKLRPLIVSLRVQARLAHSDRAHTKSGPHCSGCPALYNCSTARVATTNILDFIGRPMPINAEMSEAERELSLLKRAEKMVKERRTALEEQVKARLSRGEYSDLFELKEQLGNRAWSLKTDEVLQMGEALGIDLLKSRTPVTPAEAVRRGLPEETMEQLVKRPSLGRKLNEINQREITEMLKHDPE